jgi:hypothetical protein
MRQEVGSAIIIWMLASSFACRQHVQVAPRDFRPNTLDPKADVQEADMVVLGYPTQRREIRRFPVRQENRDRPQLQLVETETTLIVLRTFKGSVAGQTLHFRHYDYVPLFFIIGPPQGPSGNIGSKGIFFLRKTSSGAFRSVVDVYRPDIPTPWIDGTSDVGSCTDASECISRFLLTFRPSYDQKRFLAELRLNARISLLLIGSMNAFALLNKLAEEADPDDVKRGACRELSEWYDVFPPRCRTLMAGLPAEKGYPDRTVQLREGLRRGMAWVLVRLRTKDESEALRYLQFLSRSSDDETRRIAMNLLNSQKTSPKPP